MGNKIKATVLVVDDDSMLREILKIMLRSEEYFIAGEASDGQEAITLCERLKPDVVLLDIMMPKMDGLLALEEIHRVSPETIVLMVSADSTMDKVEEAIKKGAAGFVVKPLNAASVLDQIALVLKNQKKQ